MFDEIIISTHAPLAGRDGMTLGQAYDAYMISTHAPLAGRDPDFTKGRGVISISTHAPLAGRDLTLLL